MTDLMFHQEQTIAPSMESISNALKIVSERSLALREAKTPVEVIKLREGKKGKQWKYIDGITVQRWLDTNYPGWQWNVLPETLKKFGGYINIAGTLKVICPELGVFREFTCYGSDEIEYKKDTNEEVSLDYAKAAETDALKRCVFRLGGFTDVYTETPKADMNSQLTEEEASQVMSYLSDIIAFFKKLKPSNEEALSSIRKFLISLSTKAIKIDDAIDMINNYKQSTGE